MLSEKQLARNERAKTANLAARTKRIVDYDRNPQKCKLCDGPLPYDKRKGSYCSHSCAARKNNLGVNRHGPSVITTCLSCGKETRRGRCCSFKCRDEYSQQKKWAAFKEAGCCSHPVTAKKYLKAVRGHKCEICGGAEWRDQPIPLVLDHINGKPSDWRLENLQLVCGNCNMQLPTFAGRNVGKGGGRPYRNARYLEGKSW